MTAAWDDPWTDGSRLGTAPAGPAPEVTRRQSGQGPLTDLADQLMEWTEELVEAIDAETEAQVAYDDVYEDEIVKCHRESIQMAIIKDVTNGRCKVERAALTRAEGRVKRWKAKVNAISQALTAAQSQAKYSGLADGGSR